MATIGRELAEKLAARCRTQKRPKYYCIYRYRNVIFDKDDFAYCVSESQYQTQMQSPATGKVKVLWASEKFRKTHG